MLRLASVISAVLLVGVPALIIYLRVTRTSLPAGRQLVLEQRIQTNARENYELLTRFARFTDRQLTEDAMAGGALSFLSEERRLQAQELVDEFYRQQR